MRIIIAGDGDTGTHMAQMLSVENQDIVLLGTNREHLAQLDMSGNFITFEGDPLSRSNLLRCGIDGAHLFVAVTPDETTNVLACQIAKASGCRRCVARVDNPEFSDPAVEGMLRRAGVDMLVFPERTAALEIARFIEHNWMTDWFQLHQGALYVVGVRMEQEGELCGKRLCEVGGNPRLFHVAAIKRGNEVLIPRGDDCILEGDTLYFSVQPDNMNCLPPLCGRKATRSAHIMITGAGRVTENLLGQIAADHNVTVIDPDKERCMLLASRYPQAVVVNAVSSDVSTLKEEGIDRCDTFVALTGSSEKNIVACMVAREHGVAKTVARIEELQYMPEAESLSIDKIINKKLINAGKILSVMLDSEISSTQCLSLENAEITEMTAAEGSRIVSRPIRELKLPREMTVAGIIRNGKGILVEGDTQVAPGDNVVIFSKTGNLSGLKKLFR